MWIKKIFLIVFFVLFLDAVYAQELDTISSIDQALIELNNLEQNQIALKNLLNERENMILEKEQLLNQMNLQYQKLDRSYLLLKNVNKLNKIIIAILTGATITEGLYIAYIKIK